MNAPTLQNKTSQKAILVISFGTSCIRSMHSAIGGVENAIAQAFPTYRVARAFTSNMILRKLQKRDALEIDTVSQALERLAAEGVQEVFCQPTHVIPGAEYERLVQDVQAFSDRFSRITCGKPLLYTTADFRALICATMDVLDVPGDTALVWMGHGSEHFADCAYAALAYHYRVCGYPNVFVGTVEGYPTLDDLLPQLRESGLRKVLLAPLMLVAGDHAQNDMAGDAPESWQSSLTALGFQVRSVLTGLGEYETVQALYVRHVADALAAQEACGD